MQLKELLQAKKILIPRFDSHGDLVLFSGFLAALIEKLPDVEVTLLVRAGQEQLATLFPSKIKWVTTNIFPYKPFEVAEVRELKRLLSILDEGAWDVLLTTCQVRTWLDFVVAAKLSGAARYAIGSYMQTSDWVNDLLRWLSLPNKTLWEHYVEADESIHEIEKYAILYRHLFDCDAVIPMPKLEIGNENNLHSMTIIKELGLVDKGFFVCLPAGAQNVSIKCWLPDRFVELLLQIQNEMRLTPLLIGHESEADVLNYVADKVTTLGGKAYKWIGQSGQLHLLAAIIHKAQFYVGNDSGPMHIAAAVGVPTVGIFGGGYWPRFLPVGEHSVGLAAVMPCFGCDWECTFEDAPCVKIIEVNDVLKVLKAVLNGTVFKRNMHIVPHKLNNDATEYIAKANNQFTRCKTCRNKLFHDKAFFTILNSEYSSGFNLMRTRPILILIKKIRYLLIG